MTRNLFFFSLFSGILLISCNSSSNHTQKSNVPSEEKKVLMASIERDPRKIGPKKTAAQVAIEKNIYKINASDHPVYGYWVGQFGKNKLNLAIAHVDKDSIFGHSICAGNFRTVRGTVRKLEDETFYINMLEPGDQKHDGIFNFILNPYQKTLKGTWKPYDDLLSEKMYTLKKRRFDYDPNIGEFPHASNRPMEIHEVENLLPEEIEVIRNEIYARHGYSFTNEKIRKVFEAKDWYIPMSTDIREELTEVEARNIDLMYNYEAYYEEYYNSYGR